MKRLQMQELVQEIQLIIDDWHRTMCPNSYIFHAIRVVHIINCALHFLTCHRLKYSIMIVTEN